MSRHRGIRNRVYSYEEDYDYDEEEDYGPQSPGMSQYMYHRESPRHQQNIVFVQQPPNAQQAASRDDNNAEDGELLASMLPFVKSAVGARFKDPEIIAELRRSNYDADRTVVSLLARGETAAPLSVEIPIPRLDVIANALEQQGAVPWTSAPPAVAVIGSAPATVAVIGEAPPPVVAEAPTPVVEKQSTAPAPSAAASSTTTFQSLTPSQIEGFARAEAKTQEKCARLLAPDAEGADGKTRISMVVVGHVDAGKSTITGHLLYKLGYVSQKVLHKFEKESRQAGKASFAFAWVMDADEEERARGVTMDVGTCFFETKTKHVTLLDAPGHRDFIPKMIEGASQADVAVLVVPAVTGEFEAAFVSSGQTREHTLLVRSLGVSQLIVAVNKMDTVDWSKERFDEIVGMLQLFLKRVGFRPKHLQFVPVSGMSGANLQAKTDIKEAAWYKGPTLVEAIDNFSAPPRDVSKPLRMSVADVSRSMTLGPLISGRIAAGAMAVGDTFLLMPVGQTLTIKGIEQDGKAIPYATAGDTVDVGVLNIDPTALSVGSILCSIVTPVALARKFEAKIMTMPAVEVPLVRGTCVTMHLHQVDESVHVSRLVSQLSRTGEVEKRKPRCLTRDKSAVVQITCPRAICMATFADCRPLGRFTLRDRGVTLAAGIITEILH